MVTGAVEQGVIKTGDPVEIVGLKDTQKAVVTGLYFWLLSFLLPLLSLTVFSLGVEMFRKLLNRGEAGDNLGALLRGIKREDVKRGQVLCAPGSCQTLHPFRGRDFHLAPY